MLTLGFYVLTAYMDDVEAVMLSFQHTASAIDERSSERMNFRAKPRIKQAIQRAAALAGVDDPCSR